MSLGSTVYSSDVVIIGAGFSGINMACQLQRELGVTNYVIYERADDYGGAWYANKYPGCGVDIPAFYYSFSWFPNTKFSTVFPPQPEILEYIRRVANAHKVPQHIKFRTEWKGARWIEKISKWHVYLEDLETGEQFVHEAKILVSAVGGYTNPKFPSLPGIEDFKGTVVHTARWNDDIDVKGRKVLIIGNGCSASQVVPAIVDDVDTITQFVRSPQYYVPMPNFRISQTWQILFGVFPALLVLIRWLVFWTLETSIFQFYDTEFGRWMRESAARKSQDHVRRTAPSRYWPLLTPSYELGCRRRILDSNYLKTLYNPKVFITKDAIASVKENSIITESGKEYAADIIVLATGFQFTQWQADSVIGRNGLSVKDHWTRSGGIGAYKTVALHDFPNLFYLLGPNSGSGHTSVLYSIECSTNLVVKLARPILKGVESCIEVKEGAELDWLNTIQAALQRTVLTGNCFSQFSDPNTSWNFFSYPFSSTRFWLGTRFPDLSHWYYS